MFLSNNGPSFHLWWKKNLVKHREVSKYYETDCRFWHYLTLTWFLFWHFLFSFYLRFHCFFVFSWDSVFFWDFLFFEIFFFFFLGGDRGLTLSDSDITWILILSDTVIVWHWHWLSSEIFELLKFFLLIFFFFFFFFLLILFISWCYLTLTLSDSAIN